ncbi:sulfite exporter TauE/SafE family protein [Flavobacterium sp.]|uniref:sulfite exporter TauE/SafE family protein n=1 Tax=Flavobacterium sp. TaxID=239 RepID=UPI002C5ECAC1|nr:sulfite exporter TauE/SafE family protein [Flavobacterium sp.]HSD07882.1 sulfite exporter TauE/SafE family protein [Flavobacterium sp.]
MITTLIVIFSVSFLAFSISVICGGGAGLMLIPVLGLMLPVSQVPAALSIGTFTSSTSRLVAFRKNICWHIVKYFVPAALPAVWFGAWLLKYVNPVYLEVVMGLFLVSNLTSLFQKSKQINATHKSSNFVLGLIGFSAGFISGLTGAVGLLFNRFYLRYGLTKEEIIATRAANEIILHLVKIVLYFIFGLITIKVVSIGVVVAISAVLSTWAMKWILPKLSEVAFRKIGYGAMVVSGFAMLAQSGSHLLIPENLNSIANPMPKEMASKLIWNRWNHGNFAMEFGYDDDSGLEIEQTIPIAELSSEQKRLVLSNAKGTDKLIIEIVYSLGMHSYEAYYFKDNILTKKLDFN